MGSTSEQTKWGFRSLLKKYGPTAARLAGHAIKAYMGLAQTSSKAQEKFWGSLLKKYGPTAARLAGKAISAYMGLAQTDTAAHSKFWGSLLSKYGPTAAKLAGHAIKAYMGLAQTSTTAVQKEKWLGMALGAAKMGWNLYKHFSLVET